MVFPAFGKTIRVQGVMSPSALQVKRQLIAVIDCRALSQSFNMGRSGRGTSAAGSAKDQAKSRFCGGPNGSRKGNEKGVA